MAKKILKTRTQFTSTLKNELYKELRQYSQDTGIPISRILDTAVQSVIGKKETKTL